MANSDHYLRIYFCKQCGKKFTSIEPTAKFCSMICCWAAKIKNPEEVKNKAHIREKLWRESHKEELKKYHKKYAEPPSVGLNPAWASKS